MLARLLFLELGAELILLAIVGYWAGLTPGSAMVAAGGLVVGIRVCLLGVMFTLAWVYRAVRPPPLRLNAWQTLRLFWAEAGAMLALYLVLHPLAPWLERRRRPPAAPPAAVPVLFIHGLLCNTGYWWALGRYLDKRGVGSLYTLTLEPLFTDIDRYAEQVAERVEHLCALTAARQVILVGHSMGGLVARAYIRRFAARERVARIITLGSPHHGSRHARFCLPHGLNVRQMWPDSAWLEALNASTQTVAITSIYSCHDNLVTPQDSAVLDGARNIPVAGVGHLTMAFSRRCQALVCVEIEQARAGSEVVTGDGR